MASTIGKVNIEANLRLRVGEQDIDLAELATALTNAGIALQVLTGDQSEAASADGDAPRLIPAPLPGEAIVRGNGNSGLIRVDIRRFMYTPSYLELEFPRLEIEGHVIETITE